MYLCLVLPHSTNDAIIAQRRFNFWGAREGSSVKQRVMYLCHRQLARNARLILVVIVILNLVLNTSSIQIYLVPTSSRFMFWSPAGDLHKIFIHHGITTNWLCAAPNAHLQIEQNKTQHYLWDGIGIYTAEACFEAPSVFLPYESIDLYIVHLAYFFALVWSLCTSWAKLPSMLLASSCVRQQTKINEWWSN